MVLRIRGRALPDGDTVDLYADGDRWTTDPVSGAELAAEGWLLPGLVDAHTHPGAEALDTAFDDDVLRADLVRHLDAGVTLVRAPGLAGAPPEWFGTEEDLPRAFHAGPWMARHGSFFDGWGLRVEEADFPRVAAAQAAATGWCKLIGDWPRQEPLTVEIVSAVVAAVHAVGGRVAMHCQAPESCHAAVAGGIDTLEHGQFLDPALLDRMAAQGTALVPTLSAIGRSAAAARELERTPRRARYLAAYDAMAPTTAAAVEAGVRVLAGTDSRPHGRIVDEIDALRATGMPTEVAVGAGSWAARSYLGLPGLVEGAPADAVMYDADPRVDPAVLAHPCRVILRGRVVR